MNNAKPLDDLEMFELLQACYPDRFPDESDESWDAALEMAGEFGDFDSLADLLGRVVMLAPTLESPLSGTRRHVLGSIEGNAFVAVVSREVAPYHGEQIAALYASQPTPENEAVRRAYEAACAFIDCHAADPDITGEMVEKHAEFQRLRAALAQRGDAEVPTSGGATNDD